MPCRGHGANFQYAQAILDFVRSNQAAGCRTAEQMAFLGGSLAASFGVSGVSSEFGALYCPLNDETLAIDFGSVQRLRLRGDLTRCIYLQTTKREFR